MGRDLLPEGEALRKALTWVLEQRKLEPQTKLAKLIDQASQRFDLTPLEADFLFRTLTQG